MGRYKSAGDDDDEISAELIHAGGKIFVNSVWNGNDRLSFSQFLTLYVDTIIGYFQCGFRSAIDEMLTRYKYRCSGKVSYTRML